MTDKKCEKMLKYYKEKETEKWKLVRVICQVVIAFTFCVITVIGLAFLSRAYSNIDYFIGFLLFFMFGIWLIADDNLKVLEKL